MQINLYSDTQSRPSEAMREAMCRAEVGDEQKSNDPTVSKLLEEVAWLLGKASAVFLPSGTMCNEIAVATHCAPGDAVIAESSSHLIRYEAGGVGAITGAMVEPILGSAGRFTGEQVRAHYARGSRYTPASKLLCVEQSCNLAGGTVWSLGQLEDVSGTAKSLGLKTHMDGARLFNAEVATGVSAKKLAAGFDSVWVDFTKGLGAPFGAVLCGSEEFINRAWAWKHRLGGAMRQAGIMAAGCLYALEHNVRRLAEDHQNAQLLNDGLRDLSGLQVRYAAVDTNIVYFTLTDKTASLDSFLSQCEKRGLRLGMVGGGIRAITYLDITKTDIENAVRIVSNVLADMGRPGPSPT